MDKVRRQAFATVMDGLLAWAKIKPDAVAYGIGEDPISFGALADDARRWAAALESLGVQSGDRVAIAIPTRLDFVRALYAVMYLGAWPVPLNPDLPPGTCLGRIDPLRCRALILAEDDPRDWTGASDMKRGGYPRILSTADIRSRAMNPLSGQPRCAPEDAAFLGLTSGTTGEPKAAIVSHRSLILSYHSKWEWMEGRDDDILATWAPHYLAMGMMKFICFVAYSGCASYLIPPSAANFVEWLRTISRVRATVTGGTNFGYRLATQLVKPETVDLRSLRIAFAGGEAGGIEIVENFEKRFGLSGVLRTGYGMTETVGTIAVTRLRKAHRVSPDGLLSCGEAAPGLEMAIADEQGRALPPGERGEIVVRSNFLFSGYFEDPELTRQTVRDGWLRTGDIGMQDEDGWLFVLGRSKAMIKRGGVTIMPREIEAAARSVEGVLGAAAVSAPRRDERNAEDIIVLCEAQADQTAPDARDALAKAVIRAVEQTLGFGPNDVLFVPPGGIPREPGGKIPYGELKKRLAAGEFR